LSGAGFDAVSEQRAEGDTRIPEPVVPTGRYFLARLSGRRKHYKTLNPGQSYTQSTFATHPWIAVDPSGRCLGGAFRPNPGRNTFQIM
jgi:hypothetical protein